MRQAETRPCGFNRVEKCRDPLVMSAQAVFAEYVTRDAVRIVPRRAGFEEDDTDARNLCMFIVYSACNGEARDLKESARGDCLSSLLYQRLDWATYLRDGEKASVGVNGDVVDLFATVKKMEKVVRSLGQMRPFTTGFARCLLVSLIDTSIS